MEPIQQQAQQALSLAQAIQADVDAILDPEPRRMTPAQRELWEQFVGKTRQQRAAYARRLEREPRASITEILVGMLAEADAILAADAELQRLWAPAAAGKDGTL